MVAHHKNDETIQVLNQYFLSIHVGASLSNQKLQIQRDDEGENISFKNRSYCELTGHYWLFKNIDSDYYGMMHYRRIFDVNPDLWQLFLNKIKFYKRRIFNRTTAVHSINTVETTSLEFYNSKAYQLNEFIKNINGENTIVIPKPRIQANQTINEEYVYHIKKDDIYKLNSSIIENYPEYLGIVEKISNGQKWYPYNMFILPKGLFIGYSEKLFNILRLLENKISLIDRTPYQKRVFGFLGERFFTYYVEKLREKKNIKIIELPILFFSNTKTS